MTKKRQILVIGNNTNGCTPEHEKIGRIQPDLLKIINLESRILKDKDWRKNCTWALKKIKGNNSCALIIRRDFVD